MKLLRYKKYFQAMFQLKEMRWMILGIFKFICRLNFQLQ